MNSIELKEKVDKATETVNKKMATIERHKKQAEKKLDIIKKNGWELDDSLYRGSNYNYDALHAISDYKWKLEDIQSAIQKLNDAKAILNNWIDKYNKAIEFEKMIAKEMPEIFISCRDYLAKEWTKSDIIRRDRMKKCKKEKSYEEFRKLYKYSEEESLNKTDDEFAKMELRQAELFIVDLYNRVKEITHEVTDWGNIHFNGNCLNGWVVGKNGKARVETILAGGYNIQRLHMRVLVHKIK